MTLRSNIDQLRLAISDQNLELIPDYEQRIAVLQELKFIDANAVVLLKGRVACEASPLRSRLLLLPRRIYITYTPWSPHLHRCHRPL